MQWQTHCATNICLNVLLLLFVQVTTRLTRNWFTKAIYLVIWVNNFKNVFYIFNVCINTIFLCCFMVFDVPFITAAVLELSFHRNWLACTLITLYFIYYISQCNISSEQCTLSISKCLHCSLCSMKVAIKFRLSLIIKCHNILYTVHTSVFS